MNDDWFHLKPYGYAPGNYMNTCRTCNQVHVDSDKRASSCRPCAEKKYNEKNIPGPTLEDFINKFQGIEVPEVSGKVNK